MKTARASIFTVYSRRLAGYLLMNGFPLLRVVQNGNTARDNYLFPNTDLLHDYIDKWQVERLKEKSINNLE